MRSWRSIVRGVSTLLTAAVLWLGVYGTALARPAAEEKEGKGASWVPSYLIVVFGVGLGMLLVCRSSRRRERARPETYEEKKRPLQID